MRSTRAVVAVALAAALSLAGCAGSRVAKDNADNNANSGGSAGGSAQAGGGMIPQLNFPAEADASVGNLVNYNPYSPKPLTSTWLYEPLMIQNGITCVITPWLATDYKWE